MQACAFQATKDVLDTDVILSVAEDWLLFSTNAAAQAKVFRRGVQCRIAPLSSFYLLFSELQTVCTPKKASREKT